MSHHFVKNSDGSRVCTNCGDEKGFDAERPCPFPLERAPAHPHPPTTVLPPAVPGTEADTDSLGLTIGSSKMYFGYRVLLEQLVDVDDDSALEQAGGFRRLIQAAAIDHNLHGFVRRQFRRNIRVEFEGKQSDVERFYEYLMSMVDNGWFHHARIDQHWERPGSQFTSFRILSDETSRVQTGYYSDEEHELSRSRSFSADTTEAR